MIRYKGVASFTKHTLLGKPFKVYRETPEMPRFDDRFLDCSIYLYPSLEDAQKGQRIGGSGFLIAIPGVSLGPRHDAGGDSYQKIHHIYAVSNRHVVKKNPVVRLNTHDG